MMSLTASSGKFRLLRDGFHHGARHRCRFAEEGVHF
jgi:hypothetical protein